MTARRDVVSGASLAAAVVLHFAVGLLLPDQRTIGARATYRFDP